MLVFGKSADARLLDPGCMDENNSVMIANNVFESLLAFKPGTTQLVPCLAKSLPTFSKDKLEISFTLRQGVKFHDGTSMDADAVIFSLLRQNDKTNPFNQYGPWKFWSSKGWSATDKGPGLIKNIIKIDNSTVKVILNRPDQSIVYNFALFFTNIVSPTAALKLGPEFKNHPVGTGPFRFVEWIKDDHIALKRFDGYWGNKPHLDGIIFKVFPDEQARILALQKGQADMIDSTGPEGMKTIEADPKLKLQPGEILGLGWLAMNCETGPFADKRLRKAVCYAIDRNQILTSVYGKTGVKNILPTPENLWGFDKSIPDYPYSPEKAKALIKATGIPTPIKINFIYFPAWRPYNPSGKRIAEIVQAQLKEVGIEAALKTFDFGTYWDTLDAGKFDLGMNGWNGQPDPDDYLFNMFTEGYLNESRWKNKEYIDLVTKAKIASGIPARSALYYKAERILMEEAPVLMLARGKAFMPMSKKVQGFVINPNGYLDFSPVSLDK